MTESMHIQLASIERGLGRIEGSVTEIKENMKVGRERMDRHDKQIAALKNRSHWLSGFAAAIGTAFGYGGTHFLRVALATAVLSSLFTATVWAGAAERIAIFEAMRAAGVYPGAQQFVAGGTLTVTQVTIDAQNNITVRLKYDR